MYKLPILNYSANYQRSKYRYSRYRNSTWLWNWNISYRDVKGILNNLSLDMLPEDSYPEHNGTIPPSEMVAHFRQWIKSFIFLLDGWSPDVDFNFTWSVSTQIQHLETLNIARIILHHHMVFQLTIVWKNNFSLEKHAQIHCPSIYNYE